MRTSQAGAAARAPRSAARRCTSTFPARMRFLPPASAVRLQFSPTHFSRATTHRAHGPARAFLVEPHAGTGDFLRTDATADVRRAGAAHRTASARRSAGESSGASLAYASRGDSTGRGAVRTGRRLAGRPVPLLRTATGAGGAHRGPGTD